MYSNYESRSAKSVKSYLKDKFIELAFRTGMLRLDWRSGSGFLTVINYHRIDDVNQTGFDSFKPNVSAHPDEFKRQMEYLSRWFNIVSVRDIVSWLEDGKALPPDPALITFDDGYLDNYTNAYPILREYDFPAVIFLTAGHIETNAPFFWDLASYCFAHTGCKNVLFPDGTKRSWQDSTQQEQVARAWITSLKSLPENIKQEWVDRLPKVLDVSIPDNYFRNLMMNWDQIREMDRKGIEFGGHTLNHPILTRIPMQQARTEINDSKAKIENELGHPIVSFAYPNGLKDDINTDIENIVADAGYKLAFTLMNGPASLREVKRNPYTVRRIFISQKYSLAEYAMHLSPIIRFRSS